jgi:uncharacterized secreted repeat protein (TIGR03808 family)
MLNRRRFLAAASFSVPAAAIAPVAATAGSIDGVLTASMRGSIDVTELGIRPGAFDDQSRAFAKILQQAADRDMPLFVPPGIYIVSNLTLPPRIRLSGAAGASRIIYGGDGHLMVAEDAEHIELSGIVFDGANRWLRDDVQGLLDFRRARHVAIDNCQVVGSGKNGIALERAGGRIERTEISGAAEAGIYSVEASGLQIAGNTVSDCANGGILVHRWQPAQDATIVSGNRVSRISARNGGTGQFGNGINLFRANNVIVTNNIVSDCAFSAIRANSASNMQIANNTCTGSGETAIYSEFAFEGAVISGNLVDGAANGISIVNFNEGGRLAVCSGNIVRNLSTEGPYKADPPGFGVGITVEADCSVTGNVVESAPRYGMHIGWGEFMRNVVATGNVIRKAGTGIAVSVAEGTGAAVISDNLIDGAANGAIVGYRWTKPATGDLALDGAGAFANLTIERNRVT